MPTLSECIEQIEKLVNVKKFNADPLFFKLVWAVIELAEALDITKKKGLPDKGDLISVNGEIEHTPDKLGEEIVDVVFYACDAYRLLRRRYPWILNMDEMFAYKMAKNMARPEKYGQRFIDGFMKMYVDHMSDEGLLPEFLQEIHEYAKKKIMSTHFEPEVAE